MGAEIWLRFKGTYHPCERLPGSSILLGIQHGKYEVNLYLLKNMLDNSLLVMGNIRQSIAVGG